MTTEYATSRAVHSTLRRLLAPWFLANGWKKRPGSSCAFVREASSGHWCLWVQVSQWGNSLGGNSFTLNLVSQAVADSALCGGPDARVLVTLSDEDKALGFEIAQQIAARVPIPPPSHQVYEWAKPPGKEGEQWQHTIANLQKANPEAWEPSIDIWLNYYAVADIEQWAGFLLARHPYLLLQSNDAQQVLRADHPAFGRPVT